MRKLKRCEKEGRGDKKEKKGGRAWGREEKTFDRERRDCLSICKPAAFPQPLRHCQMTWKSKGILGTWSRRTVPVKQSTPVAEWSVLIANWRQSEAHCYLFINWEQPQKLPLAAVQACQQQTGVKCFWWAPTAWMEFRGQPFPLPRGPFLRLIKMMESWGDSIFSQALRKRREFGSLSQSCWPRLGWVSGRQGHNVPQSDVILLHLQKVPTLAGKWQLSTQKDDSGFPEFFIKTQHHKSTNFSSVLC